MAFLLGSGDVPHLQFGQGKFVRRYAGLSVKFVQYDHHGRQPWISQTEEQGAIRSPIGSSGSNSAEIPSKGWSQMRNDLSKNQVGQSTPKHSADRPLHDDESGTVRMANSPAAELTNQPAPRSPAGFSGQILFNHVGRSSR